MVEVVVLDYSARTDYVLFPSAARLWWEEVGRPTVSSSTLFLSLSLGSHRLALFSRRYTVYASSPYRRRSTIKERGESGGGGGNE